MLEVLNAADCTGESDTIDYRLSFNSNPPYSPAQALTENQPSVFHSKSVFEKRNIKRKGQSNLALGVSSSLIKYKV